MTWRDNPMCGFDTETTGPDPETARAIQVCLGHSEAPGDWTPKTWHIIPDVPIPAEATAVHGLTLDMVTERATKSRAESLQELRLWLAQFSGRRTPIVGHNLRYDLTLLDREFRRTIGEPLPGGLIVLDTLVLWRQLWTQTGSRSLGKLAERHGITFPAHDAAADALASLRLLHILANSKELLRHVPAKAMH